MKKHIGVLVKKFFKVPLVQNVHFECSFSSLYSTSNIYRSTRLHKNAKMTFLYYKHLIIGANYQCDWTKWIVFKV